MTYLSKIKLFIILHGNISILQRITYWARFANVTMTNSSFQVVNVTINLILLQ